MMRVQRKIISEVEHTNLLVGSFVHLVVKLIGAEISQQLMSD